MTKFFLSSERLVFTYKENQTKISELKKVQDKFHEQSKKKYNKIYCEYDDKITALEKQRDKIYRSLEKETEKLDNKTEKKIDYLYTDISKVQRIIYFLNQSKIKLNFDVTKTTNRDRYLELIGQYKEPFNIHLALYIAENNRPKNKYSLIIVGMCRFGDRTGESKIPKLPYDYGCDLSHSEIQWFDIAKIVKHFDSIESAKKYAKTHYIQTMLHSFFQEYSQIDTEYTKAISHYSLEDFAEILKGDDD